MKRSWWAVLAVVVAVSVVLLTQPWQLLGPDEQRAEPASEQASEQGPEEPEARPEGPGAWTVGPDGAGGVVDAEPASDTEGDAQVVVDRDARGQEWRGVGGTLTDAAVEQLQQAPDERQGELLGAASWLRLPLTATDSSADDWTWDWDGERATPHPRAEAAVEVVRRLAEQRDDLAVVVTPWSAPPAMKTTGELRGGALRQDALADYAAMLVSQVEELEAAGVPVAAVTLGHEPTVSDDGPSMTMTADQQAELGELVRDGLPVEVDLWAGDVGWGDRPVVDAVLSGAPFASFDGAAFHCDGGDPRRMETLPVPAVVTECADAASWSEALAADGPVAGSIAAGASGLLLSDLGQDAGPGSAMTTMLDRAAPPGSRVLRARVEGGAEGLQQLAFATPDGETGVLVHNGADAVRTVTVSVGGKAWPTYAVDPGALLVVRR